MNIIVKNIAIIISILLSVFFVFMLFTWNSDGDQYTHCSIEEFQNQKSLKPAYRCYYKVIDEDTVVFRGVLYVLCVTLLFQVFVRARFFWSVILSIISYSFWLYLWGVLVDHFYIGVQIVLSYWGSAHDGPWEIHDHMYFFKKIDALLGINLILAIFFVGMCVCAVIIGHLFGKAISYLVRHKGFYKNH